MSNRKMKDRDTKGSLVSRFVCCSFLSSSLSLSLFLTLLLLAGCERPLAGDASPSRAQEPELVFRFALQPNSANKVSRSQTYSGGEKIRIVLEGLRGEETVAELCRREGINESVYYRWSKEFLEAGKQRLVGNSQRQASSDEVAQLRRENDQLKELVALSM